MSKTIDYVSKKRAIQAIADYTTFRDRETIERECDNHVASAEGWLGGIRDAMDAIDDLDPEFPKIEPAKPDGSIYTNWQCGACKERIRDSDRFCWFCGTEINWDNGLLS